MQFIGKLIPTRPFFRDPSAHKISTGRTARAPAQVFIHPSVLLNCTSTSIFQESSQRSLWGSAYTAATALLKGGIPLKCFTMGSGRTEQTELNPIKLLQLLSPSEVICQCYLYAEGPTISLSRAMLRTPNQKKCNHRTREAEKLGQCAAPVTRWDPRGQRTMAISLSLQLDCNGLAHCWTWIKIRLFLYMLGLTVLKGLYEECANARHTF